MVYVFVCKKEGEGWSGKSSKGLTAAGASIKELEKKLKEASRQKSRPQLDLWLDCGSGC